MIPRLGCLTTVSLRLILLVSDSKANKVRDSSAIQGQYAFGKDWKLIQMLLETIKTFSRARNVLRKDRLKTYRKQCQTIWKP